MNPTECTGYPSVDSPTLWLILWGKIAYNRPIIVATTANGLLVRGGHGGVGACICLSTDRPRADALLFWFREGIGIPLGVALPLGFEPRLDGLTVRCTASYARGERFVLVLLAVPFTQSKGFAGGSSLAVL